MQTVLVVEQSNKGATPLADTPAATRGLMLCNKCGVGIMIGDHHGDVMVHKCWVCGNRIYADHPKRWGGFVCSRCNGDLDEMNELGLCRDCLKLLHIHGGRMKARTYGETICVCGRKFIRKSPTQRFHSKRCRNDTLKPL